MIKWARRMLPPHTPLFRTSTPPTLLTSPRAFYEEILGQVGQARERLVLGALYVGDGEKERDLLGHVVASGKEAPGRRTSFLVDYNRGTREQESGTSVDLLAAAVDALPVEAKPTLSAFKPSDLALARLLPPKYREVLGVSHLKVFVFDDNVIISGANLSHDYFTDRTDRYMLLHDVPDLADWLESLVSTVSTLSHVYTPNSPNTQLTPPDPNDLARGPSALSALLHQPQDSLVDDNESHHDEEPDVMTLLAPTLQFGPWGITHDEKTILSILSQGTEDPALHAAMALAYINLTPDLEQALTHLHNPAAILSAAPEANGFFGASGLPGYVPQVYSYLAHAFYTRALSTEGADVALYEWARSGMTFHAKGLWVWPDQEDDNRSVNIIGSSNYGSRSFTRDLESQIAVFSNDPRVSTRFRQEVDALFHHSSLMHPQDYLHPSRVWPPWLPRLAPSISDFF